MKKISILLACLGWHGIFFAQKTSQAERYLIRDSVLIDLSHGHTISATIVRLKEWKTPEPVALMFNIYADTAWNLREAKSAADHGYIGVVADTRGKRLSQDTLLPYEHEQTDVYEVIDWIARQSWCNGKIGMYGGSYLGFAQWAGLKHRVHPALKTIVPYVAAIPGQGLPMENNVFLNANYQWAFYVGNNKYTDTAVNNDNQRWNNLNLNWFASGVSYRKIDSIDGQPNPLLQRWLQHPSYDAYWQAMVPYEKDFAHIHIPVLAIDGYYNDSQVSSLDYLRMHHLYAPDAQDYLVIGPYDHFGAQRGGIKVLRGYPVDSVALISTRELTFQWMDYIMKGKPKPAILKDHINYEVMGSNAWQHAIWLDKMYDKRIRMYFSNTPAGRYYQLALKKQSHSSFLMQTVDMADHTKENTYNYPYPIIQDSLDASGGLAFISEPMTDATTISGNFSGMIRTSINKKDMDFCLSFYEVMPDGRFFQFSYYLGRASYANDPTRRQLLTPGRITGLPFTKTKLTSRRLQKGSRLLILLNVNKSSFSQVNYGTGKDVSDETVKDAGKPLMVKWYNDSYIDIPVQE